MFELTPGDMNAQRPTITAWVRGERNHENLAGALSKLPVECPFSSTESSKEGVLEDWVTAAMVTTRRWARKEVGEGGGGDGVREKEKSQHEVQRG